MILKKPICKRLTHCCLKATSRPQRMSLSHFPHAAAQAGRRDSLGQSNKHHLSSGLAAQEPRTAELTA